MGFQVIFIFVFTLFIISWYMLMMMMMMCVHLAFSSHCCCRCCFLCCRHCQSSSLTVNRWNEEEEEEKKTLWTTNIQLMQMEKKLLGKKYMKSQIKSDWKWKIKIIDFCFSCYHYTTLINDNKDVRFLPVCHFINEW